MKTCKDCIHYDCCHYHITEETSMTIEECSTGFLDKDDVVAPGEWIETGYKSLFTEEVECSHCGKTQLGTTKYCPNCGARMEYSGKIKTGFYLDPKNYHISQRLADGGNK